MNWIRVAADMKSDPSVGLIAELCDIGIGPAVGYVVNVLGEMATQAKDGSLAAVPTRTLEQWAAWEGKRGLFAKAFREALCSPDGVVRSWERYNGAAIRKADADIERLRQKRREKAAQTSQDRRANVAGRSQDGRTDIARASYVDEDEDENNSNNTDLQASLIPEDSLGPSRKRAAPKKPPAEPKFPHFTEPYRSQVIDAWKTLGTVNVGQLFNAIGPCFLAPDSPGYVPPEYVTMGVVDYCGLILKGKSAAYVSPTDCAKRLLTLARNCERLDKYDPVARMDANFMAIHGHRMAGAGAA